MRSASDSAWQLNVRADKATSLQPVDSRDYSDRFLGGPERDRWTGPPPYEVLTPSYGFKDFVALTTSAPIVSERAKDFIGADLSAAGVEFLSFGMLKRRHYFLMNITKVIDAIDFPRSDIFFSHIGAEGSPRKIVLKEAIPSTICFFKLERLRDFVFVQDDWAAKLASSHLTGFGLTHLTTNVFETIVREKRVNDHPLLDGRPKH